jgi:hypothetical protein
MGSNRAMAVASRWRSRTTNDPLAARANGNTKQGRRISDLYREHLARLGDPDDVLAQTAAIEAAELQVAVENARTKVLADAGNVDLTNALVRLVNISNRAAAKLKTFPGKPKPTLADHLARRAEQDIKQ